MDELIAFITARLDEDEAAAKAAQSPSPWKAADHEADSWIVTDASGEPLIYDEGTPSLEEAAHIARHDPARVLREVDAGRRILTRHEYCAPYGGGPCDHAGTVDEPPCPDMRDLAARWSDHPACRQEWAVS